MILFVVGVFRLLCSGFWGLGDNWLGVVGFMSFSWCEPIFFAESSWLPQLPKPQK